MERTMDGIREMTLSDIERLRTRADEANVPLELDEEMFGAFYERTSRALWAYLSRVTRDPHLADDLLQEAYYRFLRARGSYESEAHRRNSLFRIATNLVHDGRRRSRHMPTTALPEHDQPLALQTPPAEAHRSDERADLHRAMAHLKPRERELLWLAYAQGSSHREIADTLGLRTGSIKLLLFRARRKLATLLRGLHQAPNRPDSQNRTAS